MATKTQTNKSSLVLTLQTEPAIYFSEGRKGLTRYKKELIKIGKYKKAATGQTFEVTAGTLDHWVSTFGNWLKNGKKVPIPLSHDRTGPEDNQGWVTNIYRQGESLLGILELLNPELALTSDVSIYVPAEVVDSLGKRYVQPITHVALCIDPVIPGLDAFEKLELSLSKGKNMISLGKTCIVLGVKEEDLTDDIIVAALEKKVEPLQLSTARTVDPMLVTVVAENRSGKLDMLLNAGLITPAIKDIISKKYIESGALTLSLSKGDEGHFDLIMQILTNNKPVSLSEKSGPQVLELANLRREQPNPIAADIAKRRKAAGLPD